MRPLNRVNAILTGLLLLLQSGQGAGGCGHERAAPAKSAQVQVQEHAHHAASGTTATHVDEGGEPSQAAGGAPHDDGAPCHRPEAARDCVSMPACAAVPALPEGELALAPIAASAAALPTDRSAPLEPGRGPEPPPPKR